MLYRSVFHGLVLRDIRIDCRNAWEEIPISGYCMTL